MVRTDHLPVCALGNVVLGCLSSSPIIGLPYATCAKETIREGSREIRVGLAAQTVHHCARYPLWWIRYFTHKRKAAFAATRRRIVNKDQVGGKVEQIVGKVKQSVGEALGNDKLANQGVVGQAKGAAKETWGNAKDAAKEMRQSRQNVATDKAHERRNKISQSVQDAKDKASEKIEGFKERHSA
jgi:uncharacterized protein YjbJ (UPF0337 family)